MDRLETLIDNLVIYLPADMPILASLMERPEGRYIVFGLILVIVLLVVWTLLAVLQMIFFGQRPQPAADKMPPIELSEQINTDNLFETASEPEDGFSFFKKPQDGGAGDLDEDPVLVAIEQEMLALRSLYTGGQILKEVYVSETRRLYAEAQVAKTNQSK